MEIRIRRKYLSSINTWIVIDSIIPYSRTGDFKREGYSIEIKHNKYYNLKLYVKSDQIVKNRKYSAAYVERHILRLEIKVHNMKFINEMLAKTSLRKLKRMSDLVHPILLSTLRNKIMSEFDKLLIVDRELFDESELSSTDRKLFENVYNKNYWKQYECKTDDPKKGVIAKSKERNVNKLKSIIYKKNELKPEIIDLIIKSLDYFIDTKDVANSTIWNNPKSEIILRKKGDHKDYY